MLFGILAVVLGFAYRDFVRLERSARLIYIDYVPTSEIIEFKTGDKVQQEITMKNDTFERVGIAYRTIQMDQDDNLIIRMIDDTGKIRNEWTINKETDSLTQIPGTNYITLQVTETMESRVQEKWILEMEMQGTGNSIMELFHSPEGSDVFYLNGEKDGTIAVKIEGALANGILYVFLAVAGGIFVIAVCLIAFLWKNFKLEHGFVVFALLLGILYMLLIPPFTVLG